MDILHTDLEDNPLKHFFNHTSELMVIANLEFHVLESNAAFQRFQDRLGLAAHDSIIAHLHPDDWPQFSGQWNHFIRNGTPLTLTLRYCSLDNSEYHVQWRANKHQQLVFLVGTLLSTYTPQTIPPAKKAAHLQNWTSTANDPHSAKAKPKAAVSSDSSPYQMMIEEKLSASNQRFSVAFHNAPTINFIMKLEDCCIIEANQHFLALLPEMQRDTYRVPMEQLQLWPNEQQFYDIVNLAMLSASAIHNQEINFRLPDGKLGTGLLSGEIVTVEREPCMLFIMNDITDAKEANEQLALLDKYHLLGSMAASIAHEVRNPLTTVKGFLQLFLRKEELNDYQSRYSLMINELERANLIITEYLSLASNKSVEQSSHNLNDIIRYICPLLEADALENGINLEIQLKPLPPMLVNEKEIRQLLLNLSRNAIEAMSGRNNRMLSIRTYQDNSKIVLVVQDQGPGIEPAILDNIFTPFFTTKKQGTGLGLAVCLSIADNHNATIHVDSSSKGTAFYITFHTDQNFIKYIEKQPS